MSKISKIAAVLAVAPVLAFAAPAFADSPGKFGTAPDEYLVKNVTQNGSYATTASATCNEELKYSIRLHNSNFGNISNISVTASLSNNGTSSMSATGSSADGATTTTSGNVAVTVSGSNATVAYEAGSTALYNESAQLVKNLPDGIVGSGVNVGDLAGSTAEFVQFKAKVNCSTTPPVKPPVTPPTVLPNTGAGDVVGIFASVAVVAAFAHRLFLSRKLSRN